MENNQPASPKPKRRWFYPTPGHLLVILLAVEVVLLLSERFRWFAFNEHKGWTVLIAVAAVGLFLLLMLIWFVLALLFRWHFQFSIRSLLVLTIAVAIPFSWLAVEMKWAMEQREAVEAVSKMGGRMYYVYNPLRFESVWLKYLLGIDFIYDPNSWDLSSSQITDAGLERLKNMHKVYSLELENTQISDNGLEHIKRLTNLTELYLDNTKISDDGLNNLKCLTNLEILHIRNTQVTDQGVKKLQKALPNLHIVR